MKTFAIIAILLLSADLAGCVGGQGLQGMSADQIKAAGKDSNVVCIDGTTLWGRIRSVYVNVDQGVIEKGGVDVDKDCGVSLKNEKQFRPAPAPAPRQLP